MPPLDERLEAVSIALGEPHHVRVDAERDGHVGVAGVLRNRGGIVTERDTQADVGVAQRVRRQVLRRRGQPVLL